MTFNMCVYLQLDFKKSRSEGKQCHAKNYEEWRKTYTSVLSVFGSPWRSVRETVAEDIFLYHPLRMTDGGFWAFWPSIPIRTDEGGIWYKTHPFRMGFHGWGVRDTYTIRYGWRMGVTHPCPSSVEDRTDVKVFKKDFIMNRWSENYENLSWYECRCNERLQTKKFIRLTHTGLVVELEHLKIKTRLTNEKFASVKGECEI